jgi:hypothetical protein
MSTAVEVLNTLCRDTATGKYRRPHYADLTAAGGDIVAHSRQHLGSFWVFPDGSQLMVADTWADVEE